MTDQSIADAGKNIMAPVTDPAFQEADASYQASASTDQVRQLFDTKAATWAAKYAPSGRLAGRVRLFTAALTPNVSPGGQVLDLGCGTGELARVLASAGWPITACDISEQMLRRAIAHDEAGTVNWVLLNPAWRVLPFAPASFDAIVAASVLEYVDDPGLVLRECASVLRPGGIVLCTVPDQRHPIRCLEWLAARAARTLPAVISSRRRLRIHGYLAYLQTSQQRHSAHWWCAVAVRSGLRPLPCAAKPSGRSTLHLLAFEKIPLPEEVR